MTACINWWPMIAITTLFLSLLRLPSARSNSIHRLPDCDFENSTFCGWENDKSERANFNWIIWSGSTPSVTTGPQSDVSGSGKYAYMEATGRQQGDKVRIISPTMRGPKCLSMMYHMYGSFMGSLIIYMTTNSNETVQWIKTGNHPDQWLKATVFFNSSIDYKSIVIQLLKEDQRVEVEEFLFGVVNTHGVSLIHGKTRTPAKPQEDIPFFNSLDSTFK